MENGFYRKRPAAHAGGKHLTECLPVRRNATGANAPGSASLAGCEREQGGRVGHRRSARTRHRQHFILTLAGGGSWLGVKVAAPAFSLPQNYHRLYWHQTVCRTLHRLPRPGLAGMPTSRNEFAFSLMTGCGKKTSTKKLKIPATFFYKLQVFLGRWEISHCS